MKPMNNGLALWFANAFRQGQGGDEAFDPNGKLNPLNKKFLTKSGNLSIAARDKYANSLDEDAFNKWKESFDAREALGDSDEVTLGQLGQLGLGAAKAHPFKAAGLGAAGFANIGGLFDNNKFGGQLGGAGLGLLASNLLGLTNPYWQVMTPMIGGALGAQFDKLRAQKEQQMQQPMLR